MSEPKTASREPYLKKVEPGTVAWCGCGHSKDQPFCDGAHEHADTDIEPVIVKFNEACTKAFCGCKRTQTPPYCDGTHQSWHPDELTGFMGQRKD